MNPVIGLNGVLIASDYTRLVQGGRGDYLEMADDMIVKENIEIQPGQKFRLDTEQQSRVFYHWYRTKQGWYKLYYQIRLVGYADYKIGFWYIDPLHVRPQQWRTS